MNNYFLSKTFNQNTYHLRPLTEEDLPKAIALCDQYVGENMYTTEELTSVIHSDDRFFYLAEAEDGEIAGYIYFFLEKAENIAGNILLDPQLLRSAGIKAGQTVGKLQSIGIVREHRGTGLSFFMMQYAIEMLHAAGIDTVFGICWKVGEKIPMEKIMNELGFTHLCDIKKFWYTNTKLKCPYCGGRCSCDAVVYYKLLE